MGILMSHLVTWLGVTTGDRTKMAFCVLYFHSIFGVLSCIEFCVFYCTGPGNLGDGRKRDLHGAELALPAFPSLKIIASLHSRRNVPAARRTNS